MGPSVESARVTFQFEGKYVVSKERSNERVLITLSLVTSTVTLTAVPGTRYSCCEDRVTSISALAEAGEAANGKRIAVNSNIVSDRLDFRYTASPHICRHSPPL